MLVFATKELWWICERGAQSDKTEKLNPNDLNAIQQKRTLDRFSLKSWRKIIRDYTKRFSTYPQDKLPAVAGVASLYSQHLLSRYLAGLWECDFFSELLWCSDRCDISRPLIERAPSWSWVSVDGAINHRWCEVNSELSLSLLSCEVTPVSTSSPYGAVIPGRCSLQVEGCLARVSWGDRRTYIYADIHHLETDPSRKRKFSDTLDQENAFRKVGRTQADAAHEEHIEDVFVLPITSDPVRGLLLQHVRGDTYRRVGLVQRLWDVSILVVSNVQRITII